MIKNYIVLRVYGGSMKGGRNARMIKIVVFIIFIVLVGYVYFQVSFTKLCFAEYKASKVASGEKINILQISDFHDKSSNNDLLLKSIKSLSPHLIVITGDFIDRGTEDLRNVYNFIDKLKKINPNIFFICGNHEWSNENREELLEGLEERKVYVLNNANLVVTINNTKINLCGVDDCNGKQGDLRKAFNGVDKEYFTILLSHEPNIAMKNKEIPADLIISGHTHGGQVRVPFLGALVAPGQGYLPKYTKGFYKVNKNIVYIDSGVGTSNSPIRFLNRSQVSFITIEGK